MAILSKGTDFTTGDQVTAAKLDALVDSATFASGAVDGSTTQLDGNGAIIVKDGGITSAKLPSGGLTSNLKITSSGTVFPNSPDSGYLQISNSDGSNVLALDPNEIMSKTAIALRCAKSSEINFQNVNAAGDGAITNMTIQEGKVGIGITSPEATLHIDDDDTEGPVLLLEGGSATEGDIAVKSGEALQMGHWDNTASEPNKFIQRMSINSDGNVVVGRLLASSSSADNGIVLRPAGEIYLARDGTSSQNHLLFINNAASSAATVGSVSTSGSATSFNTSSDYRLKEDIVEMQDSISRVQALKPVNFAWKLDGTRVDGFLAHEAQEVVPEAVTGTKDAVDEDGQPDYQGIDQSKIVPLLTKALQEALTKIESLEARVAALES